VRSSSDVHDTCSVVPKRCTVFKCVVDITVNSFASVENYAGDIVSLKAIDPLLRHTSLRIIEFTAPLKIGLSDSDLSTMAKAWPFLEVLNINQHSDWDMHPLITLNGVCTLLDCCPRLSMLSMPIHVMASDRRQPSWQLHTLQRTTKGRGNLSEWYLLDSAIDDPVLFSVVISRLAPDVAVFSWQYQHSITKCIQEAQRICAERGNIASTPARSGDSRRNNQLSDQLQGSFVAYQPLSQDIV